MTAMNYLRKPLTDSGNVAERKKTVVDVYVEKQRLYTQAQIEWDTLQDKNAGMYSLWLSIRTIGITC